MARFLFKLRSDTASNWVSANPILALGEPGYEYDTGNFKLGDGVSDWNSLAYFTSIENLDNVDLVGQLVLQGDPISLFVYGGSQFRDEVDIINAQIHVSDDRGANVRTRTFVSSGVIGFSDGTDARASMGPLWSMSYASGNFATHGYDYVTVKGQIRMDQDAGDPDEIVRLSQVEEIAGYAIQKSMITTKGDQIIGDDDGAPMISGVGDDGRLWQADSTASGGIRWGRKISHGYSQPYSPMVGDIWFDLS